MQTTERQRKGYLGFGSFHSDNIESLLEQDASSYKPPPLPFDDPASDTALRLTCTDFGAAARRCFRIDFSSWTFINHGAFGAPSAAAMAAAEQWRERCEAQPLRFIDRELLPALVRVIRELALFVNCSPQDLVLLPNATSGLNAVINSVTLAPGDVVYSLDIGYGSVKKMLAAACAASGARHVEGTVPLPLRHPDEVVAVVAASLPAGARLAVFDAVTSNTALVLPLPQLVQLCRTRGVPVLIDAAHAAGMLPIDILGLAPDYYVSNCHKWLCGARGAGFLYAAPSAQAGLRPAVTSHGSEGGFVSRFIWDGCRDYSPALAVGTALRWWRSLGDVPASVAGCGDNEACCDPRLLAHSGDGGAEARTYMYSLLRTAADSLSRRWGTTGFAPASMTAAMTLVGLPTGGALPEAGSATSADAKYVQDLLHHKYSVEAPIKCVHGTLYVRISAHVYNTCADYDQLADAVETIKNAVA